MSTAQETKQMIRGIKGLKRWPLARLGNTKGGVAVNRWQLVFLQSKVNECLYDEDQLPQQNWAWPQGTWFQERLRYIRETQGQILFHPALFLQPSRDKAKLP